ncbi:MAG: peroxiredoxin [Nitrosomonas sp.]|nr:peroxiredoxin [Nitrosomonas sp.]MCP5250804.1 peroxiredoxin [Burkholderiales bacterium]MDR4520730.1 peroxiredoxin [Nitrosomonas sp.]HQU63398.1 peroxiredoxin [Nitrosomonas sp.]
MLEMNKPVTDFQLPATSGGLFSLSQMRGKNVILYFYPKDNTPGCTTEGEDFRDNYAAFQSLNCDIIGISRDSIKSHENFKAKMNFPFELLSDEEEIVCQQFDVIKMKNMYGKQVRGIERSTFLIDANGNLRNEWRGVKVAGHVMDVLESVKAL